MDFAQVLKKFKLMEKFELTGEKRMKKITAPKLAPIYKQSMMSVVWNISIGQLGLAAWLCSLPAPAHLLVC